MDVKSIPIQARCFSNNIHYTQTRLRSLLDPFKVTKEPDIHPSFRYHGNTERKTRN